MDDERIERVPLRKAGFRAKKQTNVEDLGRVAADI